MPKTNFTSVDAYIAAQPEAARPVLKRVRALLRAALPKAEEVISYQIPAYKLGGRAVIYFAGWKKHYSLYPLTDDLITALGAKIETYETRKGTIRFPLDAPIPEALVTRIAKFRAKEVAAEVKAKKTRER